MCRVLLFCLSIWGAAAQAQVSNGIAWSYQVRQAIEQARQTSKPLMFWIVGRTCDDEDRVKNRELAAFADARVVELAKDFVTVRLSRSANAEQLKTWDINPKANLILVFSTPAGEKIDVLHPSAIVEPESLARKMALVIKSYRRTIFEKEIQPVLDDPEARPEALADALNLIDRMTLTQADAGLIALLDRDGLEAGTRVRIFTTLAKLSTPAAVDCLLKAAREEDAAAEALQECTPDAAERMLDALDGDYADLLPVIYEAAARICGLRNVKPSRFWSGENEFVKNREIKRVRDLVADQAERWRRRHAELR